MKYPGPKSRHMLDELKKYVISEPQDFVIDLEQSQGMYLTSVDGQKIFDWGGYYGSKLLGHNHPRLARPEYVKKLTLAANNKVANPDFLTPECLEYYRWIHALAPQCMKNPQLEVYAVNSGAEAIENMMKYFINLFHHRQIKRGRIPTARRFLYFDRAFHGRTVFALNVTQMQHDPIVTKDFHGLIPGNIQIPFPALHSDRSEAFNQELAQKSLESVEDAFRRFSEEIVGVIVEPLQGAGGQRLAVKSFYQGLSQLCHRYGVYLGFDEIQTSGGQTGSFFAIDQFALPHPPQAVAAAKKMGNGVVYMLYPMQDEGVLDSTWGGTLADMVRFVEEIQIVQEEKLIEQVPEKTQVLLDGLKDLQTQFPDLIENIRGMGLYQGFSLKNPAHKSRLIQIALQEEDLLLLGASTDTIRLRPVLDVSVPDIQQLMQHLKRCFERLPQSEE